MKRAFLRKVRPVSHSTFVDYSPIGDSVSTSSEAKRRTHTSAAMVGLALSMGATGLLMPRQGDGAQAAIEPQAPETPSSVSQIAAAPERELQPDALSAVGVEHTVRRGQTLQKIANLYRISVETLAAANDLPVTATVRLGQVLKVPVSAAEAAAVDASQLVASADLERLPVAAQETQNIETRTERDRALSRLEQQRIKLKNSLAELRRGESNSLIAVAPNSVQSAEPAQTVTPVNPMPGVNLPSLAVLPTPNASATPVEPDWMRVGQSLDMSESAQPAPAASAVQPPVAQPHIVAARPTAILPESSASYQVSLGDTIAEIARNHNVRQSDLIAANRLGDPNVIFVGQVLRVPATQSEATSTASAASVPSVLPKSNAAELAAPANAPTAGSAQFVQNPQAVAAAPSTILPGLPAVNGPVVDPLEVSVAPSPVQSGQNSYVQSLVSEVRALRDRHLQQRTGQTPTMMAAANVDSATSLTNSTTLAPATLDNEVVDIPEAVRVPARTLAPAARTATPATQSAPAVVAAAPLGSESYAPLLEPVTGRMVSPSLPSLPDADKFLPEGALNGYIWPARGVLSSGYGWRWGRMHQGIDIAADIGTPIYAAASGVIEYAGWNSGGYGNMVEIRHSDGSMTRYAHMNAVYVQVGQRISQSEQIGEMGSTGYSTGPHLHFEVHLANEGTVNPMAYLPSR